MSQVMSKIQGSSGMRFYRSFSPASRAALLFALPFMLVDAIHYYTAGTALLLSFPLVALLYFTCGMLAAKLAKREGQEAGSLPRVGRSATLRLWLISTVLNTLVSVLLGFASLGVTMLGGALYLCLFAPLHALGSALVGWLGGWVYQQYAWRIQEN